MPPQKRPQKPYFFDSYLKFRKHGKTPKDAQRLAKRFEALKALKERHSLLGSSDAIKTAISVSVKRNLQERLEKMFEQKLGRKVSINPLEPTVVDRLFSQFVETSKEQFDSDFQIQYQQFIEGFLPKYVKWRSSGKGGTPETPDFQRIYSFVYQEVKEMGFSVKALSKSRLEKIVREIREGGLFQDYFPISISLRRIITRARNELKTNDPATQRQIINLVIRVASLKAEVNELLRQTAKEETIERYLHETYRNFESRPTAVKKRLRQEAIANIRGVIGFSLLKDYYGKRLAGFQARLQKVRNSRIKVIIDIEIEMMFAYSLIQKIFKDPNNVRYAQREIAHLWQ